MDSVIILYKVINRQFTAIYNVRITEPLPPTFIVLGVVVNCISRASKVMRPTLLKYINTFYWM